MALLLPFPSNDEDLKEICDKAKDWALMHGIVLKTKSSMLNDSVVMAPFSLMPSSFKRKSFEEVVQIQTSINELLHKVAHDHNFLEHTLKSTIQADEFTRRLYQIYDTVRNEGFKQSISLGILRTDYLPHSDMTLKQVEMNTIACSFSALGNSLCHLHRYILTEMDLTDILKSLPENNALRDVSNGIFIGWQHFGDPKSCIVFLVEEVTYNIADQRFLEYHISSQPGAPKILRKTLRDVTDCGKLDDNFNLILDGHIVGLFYLRVGYDPSQYFTEAEWSARLLIERSTAIKCPNIQMHLAGTKKVQQKLAEPGVLEKFIDNELVRKTFVPIYSLDPAEGGEEAVQLGLSNPESYVLKPQREGGGHNIYGAEIASKLKEMSAKERLGYILMERILPTLRENIFIKANCPPVKSTVISELGIFGVIIGYPDKILVNTQAGHMLRSKSHNIDEGGVAAGFAFLDSPLLV